MPPDDRENEPCQKLLEGCADFGGAAVEASEREKEAEKQAAGNLTAPSAVDLLNSRISTQESALTGLQGTLNLIVRTIQERDSVDLTKPGQPENRMVPVDKPIDELMELEEVEPEVIKRKKALMERVLTGGVLMGSSGGLRSVGEMKLAHNEDSARVLANSMKVQNPTADFEFQYNTVVDEHTAQVIRLMRIEALATMPLEECEQLTLEARAAVAQQDCEVLRKKREILSEVLKQHRAGRSEVADGMMRLYREEARGYCRDPDAERFLKKAKQDAKEDEGVRLLKALETRNRSLEQFMTNSSGTSGAAKNFQPASARGPSAKPGGQSSSQQRHTVRWVDGAVYDASLAGVQAPDPAMFPMGQRFRMDAANGGVCNSAATCSIICSGCNNAGHQFSECPPRDEQKGGKRYVNFRWLYGQKFCGPDGKP